MLYVGVEAHVLNHLNLIVGVVDNFKVGHRGKIEHLLDAVIAGIQFDQVLDVANVGQRGKLIVRYIEILQVFVTSDTFECIQRAVIHVHSEVSMPSVVESLAQA